MNQLEKLSNRLFGDGTEGVTSITGIIKLVRSIGGLGDLLGREFIVKTPEGKVVYIIEQKGYTIGQINTLLQELTNLEEIEKKKLKRGIKK